MTTKGKQFRARYLAITVAIVLLLSGCAVLWNLQSKSESDTAQNSESSLSLLQNVEDSPNYQAAKEWDAFLSLYDVDKSILHSLSNEEVNAFSEEYYSYTCYTEEMANQIDNICQKYGLQKRGIPQHEQSMQTICYVLHTNSLISPTPNIQIDDGIGYIYRSGTFKFEANTQISQIEDTGIFDLYCAAKTDFDDSYMVIDDIGNYEQWEYTRTDGRNVLIVLEPNAAYVFCNNTNYFLQASLTFMTESTVTKDIAEEFAEKLNLDFNLEHIGDLEWSYLNDHKVVQNKPLPLGTYQNGTYDERVRFHLENKPNPEQLQYSLFDVDGDGDLDLLIGRNDFIRYIYMSDGTDVFEKPFNPIMREIKMTDYGYPDYTNAASYISICEGNKALYVFEETDGSTSYMIAGIVDGEMKWTDILKEDATGSTYYSLDTLLYEESPISKEEFQKRIDSCIPIKVELNPISQYPFAED